MCDTKYVKLFAYYFFLFFRDAEVQRLTVKVINPLSQYQSTCKSARENIKNIFTARDEKLKRKKLFEKIRGETPKNQQRIVYFV